MIRLSRDSVVLLAMVAILLAGLPAQVRAQSTESTVSAKPAEVGSVEPSEKPVVEEAADPWRLEFNAWAWLMGVYGDVGARGREASISLGFLDILDNSDSILAFSGRIEVGYERLGFYADGMYTEVGADNLTGPAGLASIDVTFEQTTIDFGLMYRIGEWEPWGGPSRNPHKLTLDAYAGARYMDVEIKVNPASLPEQSESRDWFDPIVGLRVIIPVADHWHLALNGDVGGFDVSSRLTWSSTGVVSYDFECFGHPASLKVGFRVMSWDYEDGSGNDKFVWDLQERGLLLGFSLLF